MMTAAETGAETAADTAAAEDAAIRARITADPALVLDDVAVMKAVIGADDARAGRQITDLRGAMVDRLETRLVRLEETHRSVVAAAYENMSGADQVHRAVLAILEPVRFSDLLRALDDTIPGILGVDALRLCLEGDGGPDAQGPLVALRTGEVDRYLTLGRPGVEPHVALRVADPADSAAIFGEMAQDIRSEAAIKLDFGGGARPGMLVFGAVDPARFGPEQGSDLIEFFGGVMQRAIRRWVS
jgi:uncharacterized protein YigA (DUF484 family)